MSRWPIARGQARALLFAFVLVVSMAGMPFLGGLDDGTAQAGAGPGSLIGDSAVSHSLASDDGTEENGTVYVGSNDGFVYAIDASTGSQEWQFNASVEVESSPTVVNDTVYVGSEGNQMFALDASTGDKEWMFNTSSSVRTSPTIVNGTVYIGTWDNNLYAIDASTGDQEWAYTDPGASYGNFESAPTVVDGILYAGSTDDNLYALDAANGSHKWTFSDATAGIGTSPTVSNGRVFFGSDDNYVYSVDAETGTQDWSFNTSDGVSSSPTIVDGTVFVGSDNTNLYALNATSGDQEWEFTNPTDKIGSSPTYADGTVFVGASDDTVYAVNASTGSEEWAFTDPTNRITSSPTVANGTVFIGSVDSSIYAIDSSTGSQEWTFGTGTYVFSSPTFVSAGSSYSDGSRVNLRTLGHHDQSQSAAGTQITGQATDQNGNPIDNATVVSHSITESALDTSDARSLERQAEDLQDELTDPLPASWDEDYDLESHYNSANDNYVLVHESDDWGLGTGVQQISSNVDEPRLQVDSDQQVTLSMWDPGQEPGLLGGNQVDNSFPGATTSGTIVVEQLGPTGETTDRRELDTRTIATVGNRFDSHDIPGVRTHLPDGVYRAYPEGASERGYTFVVGSPSDLAESWESDLRDEANALTDRANRIRDLVGQDKVVRATARTDANGQFTLDVPSNTVTTDLKAMKADGTTLEGVSDPTLEDLRKAQAGGYNGTFYLPSPEPNTVEPPASNVSVTMYRSPEVPLGNMESFADLMSFLNEQRLNETVSELESEYNTRLEEMERDTLERVYHSHRLQVETIPGTEDRYLERSTFDEIQDAEDLSNSELETETRHMQVALAGVDTVEPPVIEPPEEPDSPIQIEDGELNAEYPIPDGIDADTVTPELHWSNGTVETIGEDYYSVESGTIPGISGETLVIEDYPVDASDPAAFDLRVTGGGDDGRLDDRIGGTNPNFGNALPQVNAIDFSTLAPGPSETVYASVEAAPETGYGELTSAEAWNDDGEALTASVDTDRDRAQFTTDGAGVHTVRLTFENDQGDQFVVTERIRAHEQSRADPATIRAAEGVIGSYAVTGEELASARIDASGDTLEVDAIAEDSDGPGTLTVKPANAMDGDENRFEVNVLHGSSEQRVQAHVPVEVHLENMEEDGAIFWRSDSGFSGDPITWDGETRHGAVDWRGDGKAVLKTYTTADGQLEVTAVESPGPWQRVQHSVAQSIDGISLPFGMAVPSGGFALLGLAGIAVHRRRRAAQ